MSDNTVHTKIDALDSHKAELKKTLFTSLKRLQASDDFEQRFFVLGDFFSKLVDDVDVLCSAALEQPDRGKVFWYYTYQFPEWVKDFYLYLRDFMIETVKSDIIYKEEFKDETAIKNHLKTADENLQSTIEQFATKVELETPASNKVAQFVKFQDNPWPVYQEQFEKIRQQVAILQKEEPVILNYAQQYSRIRQLLTEQCARIVDSLAKQRKNALQVQQQIKDKVKPNWEAILYVEDPADIQLLFRDKLQQYIDALGNFRWPLYAVDGVLYYRELDLRKNMQRWAEYYLYPDLLEIWQAEEFVGQEYSLTMSNVKNTIQLQAQNEGQNDYFGETPLATLLQVLSDSEQYQRKILANIDKHAAEYTFLAHVFNKNKEIEIPLQTLRLDTSVKSKIQQIGTSIGHFFSNTYRQATGTELLSPEEKAIRCISQRMMHEENNHYDTLFLNKNFIGDLLLVKRHAQEQKIHKATELWKQGFEIGVLVRGNRLSGITTFMEQIDHHFFHDDAIFIAPDQPYSISGRKFEGQQSLKKVLQHLKNKFIPGNSYAIFIDDLHAWQSKELSLLENMAALVEFLRVKPEEFFVVVGCHDTLANYLNNRYDFENCFNTHISLNQATRQEIRQAIMVRHGASHRIMVNLNNEQMDEKEIQTQIDQISNIYKNNLGAILQAWTFHTCEKENREIQFDPTYYTLPDFFDDSECIMLKHLLTFGKINEYQLSKMIPRGFDKLFGARLNRLIRSKVLIRDAKGWLYINPVILYDIRQILDKRNVLP